MAPIRKKNTECSLEGKAASTSSSFCAYEFCTVTMIPSPSMEKQRKTWFTCFGAFSLLERLLSMDNAKHLQSRKIHLSGTLLLRLINNVNIIFLLLINNRQLKDLKGVL